MNAERFPYPTDDRGIPVIPNDLQCYELCLKGAKQHNKHHLQNRSEAKNALERQYSNAASMIIKMCMCRHEDLHSTYAPPRKPNRAIMEAVARGEIVPLYAYEAGVEVNIRTKAQMTAETTNSEPIPYPAERLEPFERYATGRIERDVDGTIVSIFAYEQLMTMYFDAHYSDEIEQLRQENIGGQA